MEKNLKPEHTHISIVTEQTWESDVCRASFHTWDYSCLFFFKLSLIFFFFFKYSLYLL